MEIDGQRNHRLIDVRKRAKTNCLSGSNCILPHVFSKHHHAHELQPTSLDNVPKPPVLSDVQSCSKEIFWAEIIRQSGFVVSQKKLNSIIGIYIVF